MFRPDELSMGKRILGYSLHTGFSLIYGIVCIYFYTLYSNATCVYLNSNSTQINLISLPVWLLGSGIYFICSILPKISLFGINKRIPAIIYYSDVYFLALPFHLAWSIIGGVVLFRDSGKCLSEEGILWIWSLSTLICHFIFVVVYATEVFQKYRKEIYLKR